jgi:death-on-curing protein
MNEPQWLTLELVIDMHAEQLALFGGPARIRDRGMLESALGRPQNKFAYGEHDLAALAAAYAFGIARSRPFIDGNKRAALAALIVFFNLNGVDLLVPQADMTAAILAVAAGEAEEDVLAQWLRDQLAQSTRRR